MPRGINMDNLRWGGSDASFALVDPRVILAPPDPGGGGGLPPPDPYTGTRPFGMGGVDWEGNGPFSATVGAVPHNRTLSILNSARAHGVKLWIVPPNEKTDYGGGKILLDRWIANVAPYVGLIEPFLGTTVQGIYVDEPRRVDRWGPNFSIAILRQMRDYVYSQWPRATYPNFAFTAREEPRYLIGLSAVVSWIQWKPVKDSAGVVHYRDTNFEISEAEGHYGTVVAMNCTHFNGGNDNADTSPSTWITPTQYEQHGLVLADAPPGRCVGFMGFTYGTSDFASAGSGWYNNQAAMPGKVTIVRDRFRSNDL